MNTDKKNDRYDTTRETWENIWEKSSVEVELETIHSRRAQETLRAYLPYLSAEDIHLEAGSGLGAVMIEMKRLNYNVIGLDYALNALAKSRQYNPMLNLVAADVHALPYPDNMFGGYLSFGVLEHFEHGMQPALREAYRVLKPGGILVLTIPYPNIAHKLVQWKRKRSSGGHLQNENFYESVYDRKELEQNVRNAGFDILTIKPTSHSFTLWGLGGPFQATGYYKTSALAEGLGRIAKILMPWALNFMTLVVARK